jgi:hypothetical protein
MFLASIDRRGFSAGERVRADAVAGLESRRERR